MFTMVLFIVYNVFVYCLVSLFIFYNTFVYCLQFVFLFVYRYLVQQETVLKWTYLQTLVTKHFHLHFLKFNIHNKKKFKHLFNFNLYCNQCIYCP